MINRRLAVINNGAVHCHKFSHTRATPPQTTLGIWLGWTRCFFARIHGAVNQFLSLFAMTTAAASRLVWNGDAMLVIENRIAAAAIVSYTFAGGIICWARLYLAWVDNAVNDALARWTNYKTKLYLYYTMVRGGVGGGIREPRLSAPLTFHVLDFNIPKRVPLSYTFVEKGVAMG